MKKFLLAITTFLLCACQTTPSVDAAVVQLKPGGIGKIQSEYRVLLTGDSLMESMGPQIKKALQGYENLVFIPIGKRSTGLSRPDYYNWPKVLEEHLIQYRPQIVFMWVGTNDPQNIYGHRGLGEPCSKNWMRAYLGKIAEIMNLTRKYKARLVFIGPPTVAEEPLDSQLKLINKLFINVCNHYKNQYHIHFINSRAILSQGTGRYLQHIQQNGKKVAIRTPDRVHITGAGNKMVMKHVFNCLGYYIALDQKPKLKRRKSLWW